MTTIRIWFDLNLVFICYLQKFLNKKNWTKKQTLVGFKKMFVTESDDKTLKNIKNTKVQEYVITKNTQHRHTRKRGNIMYIKWKINVNPEIGENKVFTENKIKWSKPNQLKLIPDIIRIWYSLFLSFIYRLLLLIKLN